ncbi:MAG: hypothetical protein H7X97_00410 [Opitutaceae bacterium]|nr:hypothetical protein [Verrucomicrobiales bacterium]
MKVRHAMSFGVLLLSTAVVQAQSGGPYDLSWSRIAGGGGTSSGGSYTLVGTIGQHEAGTLSGGNYTLDGGFLSGIFLVQTPGAPKLSIAKSGGNVIISWPLEGSDGFAIQQSGDMATPASWDGTGLILTTNGANRSVTVPVGGLKFFRLKKP